MMSNDSFDQVSQNDIYNIGGDLNIERLTIEGNPEILEKIKESQQKQLNREISFDYLGFLNEDNESKSLVYRENLVFEILNVLNENFKLLLYGEPGIGKTTLLWKVSQKLSSPIYISLKGKHPKSVLHYLINKIRSLNKNELIIIESEDEGIHLLNIELQNSSCYILIDDCEQDTHFIKKLSTLEAYNNKFIFSSRIKKEFEEGRIKIFEIKGFDDNEVKEYLKVCNIRLSEMSIIDLINASKGNPLYLYYFSRFQISPLPADLQAYQASIWHNLDEDQQVLLSLIVLPLFPIYIETLTNSFNSFQNHSDSPVSITNRLRNISSLINIQGGVIELFHPYFKEFIINYLHNQGLTKVYKKQLGNTYLIEEDFIQATYLLIEIEPDKVSGYIFDILPEIIQSGFWHLGNNLLQKKIEITNDLWEKGYAYYHLSNSYLSLGAKHKKTSEYLDKAAECFNKIGDEKWQVATKMMKAIELVEHGEVDEGVNLANSLIDQIPDDDALFKGQLFINLSKIYVDTADFSKAADLAKQAFDIFKSQGFKEGMYIGLTNLVSCLVQLDELELAENYSLITLEIANEINDSMIKTIILNSLTSICRRKNEYEKAKNYSYELLKLCREKGFKDKVVINLINLGNIYKDELDYNKAIEIYNESIILAKEYGLEKHEGRAYWVLSKTYRAMNVYEKSREYAEKAIATCTKVNYTYGIANAYVELAKTFEKLDDKIGAAKNYQDAAEHYFQKEDLTSDGLDCLFKAVSLWNELHDEENALKTLDVIFRTSTSEDDYDKINDYLKHENDNINKSKTIYLSTYNNYFEKNLQFNLAYYHVQLINYCKKIRQRGGAELFLEVTELIFKNIGKHLYAPNLAAISIEQSGDFFESNAIITYLEYLSKVIPSFYVRRAQDFIIIIFFIEGLGFQFQVESDERSCLKLATQLIILIRFQFNSIFSEFEPPVEKEIKFIFFEENEKIFELLPNIKFEQEMQTVTTEKTEKDIPELVIVSKKYESKTDLNVNINNKTNLYFLLTAFRNVINQFFNIDINKKTHIKVRKKLLSNLALVFNYDSIEQESSEGDAQKYHIDIEGLKKMAL